MPDRKYLEFMFYATQGRIAISRTMAEEFHQEIERIKIEKLNGLFFYRGIRETIEHLDKILNKNEN